jgi:hypothetical protein
MRIILILLCFILNQVKAQHQPIPTQFDKFINQPSIEWAAYANDTLRFEKTDLNKLLIRRFSKNEIKSSLSVYSSIEEANHISYLLKPQLDSLVLYTFGCTMPVLDSNGITVGIKIKSPEPYIPDTLSLGLTDITQILYIENGKLRSYIPWVSPRIIPIATSTGISLGNSDYFSSCFNFKYNYQWYNQDKNLFLSHTKRILRVDTVEVENKLKELYGRNLVETLWSYILENKYALYLPENNQKLFADDITTDLIEKLTVPIYDSLGNATGKFVKQPINPKIFTAAELEQDWYYDYTRNIVFNKIKALHLYAKKWTPKSNTAKSSPILKIVFN